MNVHSNFILNSKTCKLSKFILKDEWLNKLWYVYTMEYYAAIKKEQITDTHNGSLEELQGIYAKWKEKIWKGYILDGSTYLRLVK